MTFPPLRRTLRVAVALAALSAAAPAAASASTWTVDDDRVQCPTAGFASVQEAVDQAAPWDTVVICDGVYRERSVPSTHANSPAQAGSRNGLTITKPLTIRGTGADKVTIMPAPELGDSLAGTAPYLRDGGGNVITVSRQSLGSSDDNENVLDLSGVTVESPDAYVEAGIAFFNTSGRVARSVVGPLRRAAAADAATKPHGWGIIQTNSLQSAVLGGIRREVTVEDSLITGFGAGGVLFDASVGGVDGDAKNTQRSNVNAYGNVLRTRIVGERGGASVPQTGVRFHAGQRGRVTGSEIVGLWSGVANQARSAVGVLLTDADTGDDPTNPGVPAFAVAGTSFGFTGYGVFNADVTNAAVRLGAPALATGNYWGCAAGPTTGASSATAFCQGRSGNDTGGAASVTTEPFLSASPTALAVPVTTGDAAPTAAFLDPIGGTEVPVGTTISPVVSATDDFGVRSVELRAGGLPVASTSSRPYEFSWTPTAAQAGTTVELTATVTDSSGQTTVATVPVVVPAPPVTAQPPADVPPASTPSTPTAPVTPATPGVPLRTVRMPTRTARIDAKGRFAVTVGCTEGRSSCRVRVLVRRGNAIVGSRTVTVKPGRSVTVRFRPTESMRRILRRGRSATVKVSLSGTGLKVPRSANVKVTPRRAR